MYQVSIASSDNAKGLFFTVLALVKTCRSEVCLKSVQTSFQAVLTKNSGNIAWAKRISLKNDSFSAVNKYFRLPHLDEFELKESSSWSKSEFESTWLSIFSLSVILNNELVPLDFLAGTKREYGFSVTSNSVCWSSDLNRTGITTLAVH